MRYLILTSLLSLSILLNAQEATFYEAELRTDGLANDWALSELAEDEKTGFFTGVKNDGEHLYLIFQSKDQRTLQKALAAGMSLSLKAKTKPKLNVKIDYPLAPEQGQGRGGFSRPGGGSGNQRSPEERQQMMIDRMNTMLATKVKGKFKGLSTTEGTLMVEESETVKVALGLEPEGSSPTFNYELRIPLIELFGQTADWDKMTSYPITIAFTVKALSNPANGAGNAGFSRGGGRGGAGGGRAGAAGRGGARRGANSSVNSEMFSAQTVKVGYTLKK